MGSSVSVEPASKDGQQKEPTVVAEEMEHHSHHDEEKGAEEAAPEPTVEVERTLSNEQEVSEKGGPEVDPTTLPQQAQPEAADASDPPGSDEGEQDAPRPSVPIASRDRLALLREVHALLTAVLHEIDSEEAQDGGSAAKNVGDEMSRVLEELVGAWWERNTAAAISQGIVRTVLEKELMPFMGALETRLVDRVDELLRLSLPELPGNHQPDVKDESYVIPSPEFVILPTHSGVYASGTPLETDQGDEDDDGVDASPADHADSGRQQTERREELLIEIARLNAKMKGCREQLLKEEQATTEEESRASRIVREMARTQEQLAHAVEEVRQREEKETALRKQQHMESEERKKIERDRFRSPPKKSEVADLQAEWIRRRQEKERKKLEDEKENIAM